MKVSRYVDLITGFATLWCLNQNGVRKRDMRKLFILGLLALFLAGGGRRRCFLIRRSARPRMSGRRLLTQG